MTSVTSYGFRLLFQKGFTYSISIDADVLCRKAYDVSPILTNTVNFSGIANQTSIEGNFSNFQNFRAAVKKYFNIMLAEYGPSQPVNPNTGVIFWNNSWAHDFELFAKSFYIYRKIGNHVKAGDQSLLAALILVENITYNILDNKYNFRTGNKIDLGLPIADHDIINLHFTGQKPWEGGKLDPLLILDRRQRNWIFEWYKAAEVILSLDN
jgi:lipopolysaccharide biosynthesis glycosyltransferase